MPTCSSILAWRIPRQAIVHGVAKSGRRLSDSQFLVGLPSPLRIILGSTSISASGAMDTHRDQAVVNQPKQLSATSAGGGQTLRRCPGTLASGYSPFCEIPSPCVWTGPGANFELTQTMRKPVGCHCHDQAIKDGTSVHASSACRLG